ncbi:MAG: hypothetical protein WCF84_06555 [Anaerolineae bacterium]
MKTNAMRHKVVGGGIAALFLAHALFYIRALGWDAVDDAYISFRYAHNAILGYGLTFNPGERVEGFTNFLWTAMMVPFAGLGVDIGRLSIVLGVLFALGTLWLATRLARAMALPPLVGALAALCLAVDGSFAIWSVSGLETNLFAFLIAAGVLFYLREQQFRPAQAPAGNVSAGSNPWGGWPVSAVLFALAAMTRPEAAAVFALTVAHQAAWRLLNERRLFRLPDIVRGVVFAALFIPYWLLRWRYYHSFFPNSFYAKVAPGGPAAQIARGWHYLSQFVGVHIGWVILLPALIALGFAIWRYARWKENPEQPRPAPRLFGMSYLALVVVAYSAYIVYVGGDWSVGRFFVPVLTPAYLLIAAGLVDLLPARATRAVRYGLTVAGVLFLLALAWSSSWTGEYGIFVRDFDAARATKAREVMGKWLKANVPPGTWIAVDAAGQVPYFSGLPAIDMFGINDLHIGRLSVPTLGEGTPGHEKFDLGYIIQRGPQYVIIYGNLLDTVTEYRRSDAQWTQDARLTQFLTLYEKR